MDFKVPDDLLYTKEHEWVKIEGSRAKIGVTDYAQSQLGDIVYVDLPPEGKECKLGETLLVVESVKTASDVYAPLSGKVSAKNEILSKSPEKVNQDPYGQGWMVEIEITNPAEKDQLLSPDDYRKLLANPA